MRFSESTRDGLVNPAWRAFHISSKGREFDGLTYQCCRFCRKGLGDVTGLWRYGIRHYACDMCRQAALRETRADNDALIAALHQRFAQGRRGL